MRDITTMRDLNRFKDEMLKMASHDLRSPLALIVGYASLIALDHAEDLPMQTYLNAIMRATERMQGLLDDMLRVEQIRKSPLECTSRSTLPIWSRQRSSTCARRRSTRGRSWRPTCGWTTSRR